MFEVSNRRACAVVGQPHATQRRSPAPVPVAEQRLRAGLRDLAAAHPRDGYRRLGVMVTRESHGDNHERVQRLCRDEALRGQVKKRKHSRVDTSTIGGHRLHAEHPRRVWALDFAYDQTADCRTLKYLTVTDEFTKHAVVLEVERSMSGGRVVAVLKCLVMIHRAPGFVWMDNGTDMTSDASTDWCRFSPTGILIIDPRSP